MSSEWISVKDKEPCVGSLVFESDGSISVVDELIVIKVKSGPVYFTVEGIDKFEDLCSKGYVVKAENLTHITHWMPLPEPPKEGVSNAE